MGYLVQQCFDMVGDQCFGQDFIVLFDGIDDIVVGLCFDIDVDGVKGQFVLKGVVGDGGGCGKQCDMFYCDFVWGGIVVLVLFGQGFDYWYEDFQYVFVGGQLSFLYLFQCCS